MKYWGASARGLVRFICPCHSRVVRRHAPTGVLEMPFLAFWGTEFHRIAKVVKYVEDMIFS